MAAPIALLSGYFLGRTLRVGSRPAHGRTDILGGIFFSAVLGWLAVRHLHYAVALCVESYFWSRLLSGRSGAICLVALVPRFRGWLRDARTNVRLTELLIGPSVSRSLSLSALLGNEVGPA